MIYETDELYHYGVKGMRWGHRRALPTSDLRNRYDRAKAAKKEANKEYSKSFNKYYNKSHQAFSLSKKKREANDARLTDAWDKGQKANQADNKFKAVKKERKQAIRDTHKQLEKQASFKEKLTYNSATRKKAAKYIVDNNMSVSEATKKAKGDAWRNSAALVATYAAIGVGVAYMNNH